MLNNVTVGLIAVALLQNALSAGASAAVRSERVHWACTTPLLPAFVSKGKDEPDIGEGIAYIYMGDKNLHSDYLAEATFTSPLDGKHRWYDTGLKLGPLNENLGSVQIEVSRYQRFDYRAHVAIVWSLPHDANVEYRDTGLMIRDGATARLGIAVHGGLIHLQLNGKDVCTTGAAQFVSASERKYFQVRTETAAEGHNTSAVASNLRLKTDAELRTHPFRAHCKLQMRGVSWQRMGSGSFEARGAFYPNEASLFTGLEPGSTCKI